MKVPARPFRILTWGETLADRSLDPWTAAALDAVEVNINARDPRPEAGAEFYTCGSHGMSIGDVLDRCNALGLATILNLDWHDGNGRATSDSAMLPGKYHFSHELEGTPHSYWQAIDKVLKWPRHLLQNVIAWQWGNEPRNKEWQAKWIAARMEQRAGKIRARGWLNVISAGSEHLKYCAGLAQVLDPHTLNDTPGQIGAEIAALQRSHPRHEIWVTEMTANLAQDTAEATEAALTSGAEAVSLFGGHGLGDFNGRNVEWNFRTHRNFVANSDIGPTVIRHEWDELFKVEVGEPPVDPPDPPDPPPPDPPDPERPPGYSQRDALNDIRWVADRVEAKGECMGDARQRKCLERLARVEDWLV